MTIERRIKDLGLTLPPSPPAPAANYVLTVQTGNLLFVSGHGPHNDGTVKMTGKLGRDLSLNEGYQAARSTGLNLLASIREAIGDLNRISRIVKVTGMVNCTEDFADCPKVINGCSDLFAEIFGEAGKHTRAAVGMQSLPFQWPVEIEMIVELKSAVQ